MIRLHFGRRCEPAPPPPCNVCRTSPCTCVVPAPPEQTGQDIRPWFTEASPALSGHAGSVA